MEPLQEVHFGDLLIHEDSLGLVGHYLALGLVEQYLRANSGILNELVEVEVVVEKLVLVW